jgi:cytochrome bd ubiquinol oxidase subunit II
VDLFSVYTVLAGVAVVALFAFHGATYLTLRTTGDFCARARRTATRLSLAAAVLGTAFLVSTVVVATQRNDKDVFPPILPAALGIAALVIAVILAGRRSGWAFATTAAATVLTVTTLFTSLYPRVMVSHPNFANSLSVSGAASAHYTLAVMSVVALIAVPVVLVYQGWTYHVFRRRIGVADASVDEGSELRPQPEV